MVDELNLDMLDRSNQNKKLRIGVSTISAYHYRHDLFRFIEANQDILPEIIEFDSAEMENLILENELDIGIGTFTDVMHNKFDIIELTPYQVVFCVRKDHPLASRSVVRAVDLAGQPLVMARSDSIHSASQIMESCSQAGVVLRAILRTSQFMNSSKYVLDFGVGALESDIFASTVPDIVQIPLDPPIVCKLGVFWKKGAAQSATAMRFIKYMSQLHCPTGTAASNDSFGSR